MSSIESGLQNVNSARVKTMLWPREHGAWGILLVPLVTGAAVGLLSGADFRGLELFTVAALALFCLRTPVEALLGTSAVRAQNGERAAVLAGAVGYAGVAAVCLAALLWAGHTGLLKIGIATALAFAAQAGLRAIGRNTRLASQMVGAIGLTSTAAGAYYVTTGALDARALVLWAANWLFAANQIHYVQLRIHGAKLRGLGQKLARGWGFLLLSLVMTAALILAYRAGLMPKYAVLAFHPVILRGLFWFVKRETPLRVKRLGWTELAHAVLFGAFFVVGYHLQ